MSQSPKISCVTITHNRVNYLSRSMKCFTDQTYDNKELLIFFTEDDGQTPDFAASRKEDTFIHLLHQDPKKDIVLEHKTHADYIFDEYKTGDEVYVSLHNLSYLIQKNGQYSWTTNKTEASTFEIKVEGNDFYFQSSKGQYLALNDEQKWLESTQPMFIHCIKMADGRAKLLTAKQQKGSLMQKLGFEVKTINQGTSNITYVMLIEQERLSLGAKRNLAVELTKGTYVAVWDDDDWYDKVRLENQMTFIEFTGKPCCTMANTILLDHHTQKGYINAPRMDGWEQTIVCKKSEMSYYGNLDRKEDTPVLKGLYHSGKVTVIEQPDLYIYNIHTGRGNTSSADHFISMVTDPRTKQVSESENEEILEKLGTV